MERKKREDALQVLFKHILNVGHKKADRTGVGTISTFGYQCRFDLKEGFPIVTTKKTAFKAAVTELLWMIGGWMKNPAYSGISRTNIKFLLDNKCYIWTEWPYKAYCQYIDSIPTGSTIPGNYVTANEEYIHPADYPYRVGDNHFPYRKLTQKEFEHSIMTDHDFAVRFGDLGPVYQKQWRDFEGKTKAVDQLLEMINKLQNKPDDRRNLSSYWNPTELDEMLLPPCHLFHQVWTRELTLTERYDEHRSHCLKYKDNPNYQGKYRVENEPYMTDVEYFDAIGVPKRAISLQMYQRSSDCFLGVPFDWVFYSLLTHMLAEVCNMIVDDFIWVSGDTHLYLNSLEAVDEVMKREPFPYPKLKIKRKITDIEDFKIEDFELDNYQHHPHIKVEVAV